MTLGTGKTPIYQLSEQTTGHQETGAVGRGVVLESNLHAIAGKLGGRRLAHDLDKSAKDRAGIRGTLVLHRVENEKTTSSGRLLEMVYGKRE